MDINVGIRQQGRWSDLTEGYDPTLISSSVVGQTNHTPMKENSSKSQYGTL